MPRPSREAAIAMALVAACAGFAVASPHFATAGNLLAVARRCIDLALVALGEMLVLAAGGIDVSAGVAMGVASIAVGKALRAGAPGVLAALAGPAVGLMLGGAAALAVVGGQSRRSSPRSGCGACGAPRCTCCLAANGCPVCRGRSMGC